MPPVAGTIPSLSYLTQKDSVVDGLSVFVKEQLPDFVSSDHPKFVTFLEAYYEWLEQKNNPYGRMNFLMELSDVDDTLDQYLEFFKSKYLLHFPVELAVTKEGNKVNERTLMKNIRDFYRAKGTEKSYRLLFRVLYDSEIEIYYPRTDILKVSDGRWTEDVSIKVTSTNGMNNSHMKGKSVVQRDPLSGQIDAYADVKRVVQQQEGVHEVTELFLGDVVGTFRYGVEARVEVDTDIGLLVETIYGVFASVNIIYGGHGYEVGDRVVLADSVYYRDTSGWIASVGGEGIVTSVGISKVDFREGVIQTVQVQDFGVNFSKELPVEFVSTTGSNAIGQMIPGPLLKYPGYFTDNSGMLSSNKKIQDGNYYQEFSYVIKSEVSLERFREPIKRIVHPAGTKVFGDISVVAVQQSDRPTHSEFQAYERPVVGHYTPYAVKTVYNTRNHENNYGYTTGTQTHGNNNADRYPAGFNPGSTASYHNYGTTGGLLLIAGTGLSTSSFPIGTAVTGSASGATAQVFEWSNVVGTTSGNLYLMNVSGLFSVDDKISAGDLVKGSVSGVTASISTDSNGNTGIKDGRGIVIEGGLTAHDHRGSPLGTAGTEGYTAAVLSGEGVLGWGINNHPNVRKIFGIDGLSGSTGHGASMGVIVLREFFLMPTGYHFHSSPGSVGDPYYGTTGDNFEYGQEYR